MDGLVQRREKQVARACTRLDVYHYLPLSEHWARINRSRRYLAPLFPSYVFACLAPWTRVELLRNGAIAKPIPVEHPKVLIDELRQIRTALEKGADLTLGPGRIARGERVRVIRGDLAGM